MKIKSLLISTTVATSLLLGACGNMDDGKDMKKSDDSKMESKMDNKDNMKDSKSNKMMKEGMFKGENKQMVEGKAMIKDDKLMLTDFKSSKGPDLRVFNEKWRCEKW